MGEVIKVDFSAKKRLPNQELDAFHEAKAAVASGVSATRHNANQPTSRITESHPRETLISRAANMIVAAETIEESLAGGYIQDTTGLELAYEDLNEQLGALSATEQALAWRQAEEILGIGQ